ncbi:hypothetical protein [Paenibacillus rigui]|uniref:hypothetical protein n=1 Tax=Paenibacillus rigui TaxID=554312 RepID=UPI003CCBE2D2
MFSAPLKAQDERDVEGYEHTFFINMIHIERVQQALLCRNGKGVALMSLMSDFVKASLFRISCLSTRDRFRKYNGELEKTDRYDLNFAYGCYGAPVKRSLVKS